MVTDKVSIIRLQGCNKSTLGHLSFMGFTCFTLEPGPDKRIHEGEFEIRLKEYGRYHEAWKDKPWYKGVPIFDVPGRREILFHPGNYWDDTRGCIMPGLVPMVGPGPAHVLSSWKAFRPFYDRLIGELMKRHVFLNLSSHK